MPTTKSPATAANDSEGARAKRPAPTAPSTRRAAGAPRRDASYTPPATPPAPPSAKAAIEPSAKPAAKPATKTAAKTAAKSTARTSAKTSATPGANAPAPRRTRAVAATDRPGGRATGADAAAARVRLFGKAHLVGTRGAQVGLCDLHGNWATDPDGTELRFADAAQALAFAAAHPRRKDAARTTGACAPAAAPAASTGADRSMPEPATPPCQPHAAPGITYAALVTVAQGDPETGATQVAQKLLARRSRRLAALRRETEPGTGRPGNAQQGTQEGTLAVTLAGTQDGALAGTQDGTPVGSSDRTQDQVQDARAPVQESVAPDPDQAAFGAALAALGCEAASARQRLCALHGAARDQAYLAADGAYRAHRAALRRLLLGETRWACAASSRLGASLLLGCGKGGETVARQAQAGAPWTLVPFADRGGAADALLDDADLGTLAPASQVGPCA